MATKYTDNRDAALAYAKRRVENMRNDPIDMEGFHVRLLSQEDAEAFAAFVIARLLFAGKIDPVHAALQAANGDPLFQHAFEKLAATELKGEITLSEPLRTTVITSLDRPPKLKAAMRRKETNYFRDIAITMLVQEICNRFDMKATTSAKIGQAYCACGITAEAMGLTYDAIAKVWGRLGKHI